MWHFGQNVPKYGTQGDNSGIKYSCESPICFWYDRIKRQQKQHKEWLKNQYFNWITMQKWKCLEYIIL